MNSGLATIAVGGVQRVTTSKWRKGFQLAIMASIVLMSSGASHFSQADEQRAIRNYQAVISGQKKLSDLTAEERDEVLIIHGMIRRSTAPSDTTDDCRDAWENARSAADDLASYAKKLMRCAESGDLKDDCSSEFRRVKSAQSDYESYSSSVSSECD